MAMGHAMTGALGPYPMSREASGTAWQPDASEHQGLHIMTGGWMLMAHAVLNGVWDKQTGPRGNEKAFVSGMLMGMARRDVGPGTVQFRAMLSPDPLMGARGYPLLLASGETANGVTPLVDRQHPHDFLMELSASYSLRLSDTASAFVYAGLPGEPAFGPPAFMHRLSILDSPEAPISHHWLDSTHITFGVVTGGLVLGNVKLEGSRFNAREPDQHRWNIETGSLDSTALRVSWNPAPTLSLQASWGHFVSPEQLAPDENQERWSASAIYTRSLANGWWSTTLAWGRRTSEHRNLDAWVLESALRQGPWTLFARAERTDNDELVPALGHHGPAYTVGKASIGAVRDFRVAPHLALGLGGLASLNFVPRTLEASYGGDAKGFMAFVRLKLD
ncbi:MAG TPA: hypothetical protein VKI45_10630 [Allosphingosinicella sp.]|nr:hypothetical protein [Allosphingosinicella sp.]